MCIRDSSDTDAPTSSHVAYSGLTSYVEGERTFFTKLTDLSGIDTTSTNGVKMFYSINNGTWTSVSATTVQSCGTTATDCRFKATTPDISAGDYVEYYWKFQDLNQGTNGANVGYDPVPPASATTPSTWVQSNAHWFFVDDVVNEEPMCVALNPCRWGRSRCRRYWVVSDVRTVGSLVQVLELPVVLDVVASADVRGGCLKSAVRCGCTARLDSCCANGGPGTVVDAVEHLDTVG